LSHAAQQQPITPTIWFISEYVCTGLSTRRTTHNASLVLKQHDGPLVGCCHQDAASGCGVLGVQAEHCSAVLRILLCQHSHRRGSAATAVLQQQLPPYRAKRAWCVPVFQAVLMSQLSSRSGKEPLGNMDTMLADSLQTHRHSKSVNHTRYS
jgi:hypothetical protein